MVHRAICSSQIIKYLHIYQHVMTLSRNETLPYQKGAFGRLTGRRNPGSARRKVYANCNAARQNRGARPARNERFARKTGCMAVARSLRTGAGCLADAFRPLSPFSCRRPPWAVSWSEPPPCSAEPFPRPCRFFRPTTGGTSYLGGARGPFVLQLHHVRRSAKTLHPDFGGDASRGACRSTAFRTRWSTAH